MWIIRRLVGILDVVEGDLVRLMTFMGSRSSYHSDEGDKSKESEHDWKPGACESSAQGLI